MTMRDPTGDHQLRRANIVCPDNASCLSRGLIARDMPDCLEAGSSSVYRRVRGAIFCRKVTLGFVL